MALTRHDVSISQPPRRLQSQNFILLEAHSLNWYQFIGRILGKALYEGILVEVAFAGFFLAKVRHCRLIASRRGCLPCCPYQWLGKQSFLDDLASLDPDLYQGLIFLKHYPGNPEELSLNFTIVNEGGFVLIRKREPRILSVRLRRVWRYAYNRPQTRRQQHPCNARQQTRVYPPRVTLSPHEADQGAE
jgi:hypothetical protein